MDKTLRDDKSKAFFVLRIISATPLGQMPLFLTPGPTAHEKLSDWGVKLKEKN